jgi:hypothetical protein
MTTGMTPTLWPTLLEQVSTNGGVLKVSIEYLRQIAGAQRMGPKVAEKIEAALEVQGLRAVPADLNRKQNEEVLLIQAGTPAYECVQAITNNDISDTLVLWLTRLNNTPRDPGQVVDRKEIRQLAEQIVDPVAQLLGLAKPYGGDDDEEAAPPTEETNRDTAQRVASRLAEVIPLSQAERG